MIPIFINKLTHNFNDTVDTFEMVLYKEEKDRFR